MDVYLEEEDARRRLVEEVGCGEVVEMALEEAMKYRVLFLAEDIHARYSMPGFDSSAMDGYAIAWSRDKVAREGERFRVVGESAAGRAAEKMEVRAGESFRVFTGAKTPVFISLEEGGQEVHGAVVMQEEVRVEGKDIILEAEVEAGEFMRRKGEEFVEGQCLLKAGDMLNSRSLALLASQGLSHVKVRRPPRVVVVTTGEELVAVSDQGVLQLQEGEIFNSNEWMLAQALEEKGAVVVKRVHLGDDRKQQSAFFKKVAASREADLLLIAGGVSVGKYDLVQEALKEAGFELGFWKVAVKPGKPMLFAKSVVAEQEHGQGTEADDKPAGVVAIGLPGNPVSARVVFELFVGPVLQKWLKGAENDENPSFFPKKSVILAEDITTSAHDHRPHYLRGWVDEDEQFHLMGRQQSSSMLGLARANALFRVVPGESYETGSRVEVILW